MLLYGERTLVDLIGFPAKVIAYVGITLLQVHLTKTLVIQTRFRLWQWVMIALAL